MTENVWRLQDNVDVDAANDDLILTLMGMPFMSGEQLVDTGDACGQHTVEEYEQYGFAFSSVELDATRAELSLIRSACPERKVPAHCSRRHQMF
jgi:hypothetical protein